MGFVLNLSQSDFSLLLLPQTMIFNGIYVSQYNGDLFQTPLLHIISTADPPGPHHSPLFPELLKQPHNGFSCLGEVVRSSEVLAVFHNAPRVILLKLKPDRSSNLSFQSPFSFRIEVEVLPIPLRHMQF